MELDLDQLGVMHPKLQMSGEVELYRRRGALALARFRHAPGVTVGVANGPAQTRATIRWTAPLEIKDALEVVDTNRLTEDGAEAVALAFVHTRSGWTVKRRVQREGFADWLLTGPQHPKMALALEVSGSGVDDAEQRLRSKLAQVSRFGGEPGLRAAVVVSFLEPRILAATTEGAGVP